MFEWILEHILLKVPEFFYIILALFGIFLYLTSGLFSYYARLLPYQFLVKPLAALFIYSGIYMYGAKQINNIWEKRVEEQQIIIESYEKASDELAKNIEQEHHIALENIREQAEKSQNLIKGLENALTKSIRDKKNVDKFYASLNKEQQKKYNSLSEEQKQEYQLGMTTLRNLNDTQRDDLLKKNKKIEDLERQLSELAKNKLLCPTVPSLIIEQHNEAAIRKSQ